jgi:hypothetical protein
MIDFVHTAPPGPGEERSFPLAARFSGRQVERATFTVRSEAPWSVSRANGADVSGQVLELGSQSGRLAGADSAVIPTSLGSDAYSAAF